MHSPPAKIKAASQTATATIAAAMRSERIVRRLTKRAASGGASLPAGSAVASDELTARPTVAWNAVSARVLVALSRPAVAGASQYPCGLRTRARSAPFEPSSDGAPVSRSARMRAN